MLDQQIASREAFGRPMTQPEIDRMEQFAPYFAYITPAFQALGLGIGCLVVVGHRLRRVQRLHGRRRHVQADVRGGGALRRGAGDDCACSRRRWTTRAARCRARRTSRCSFRSSTTRVRGAAARLDRLFLIWWILSLAIGLGVLYRKRTAPIAVTLFVVYAAIALIIAAIKTASTERKCRAKTSSLPRRRPRSPAAVVAANLWYKRDKGLTVTTEAIKTRDLDAIVSASGKIQPKRLVNISADTPGPGGQPRRQRRRPRQERPVPAADRSQVAAHRVENSAASLQAARPRSIRCGSRSRRRGSQLHQAQQNLARQQDLWKQQLTTREALEKAENDVKVAESTLHEREKQIAPQDSRITQEAPLESARYDLSKVRIESPIDGIVTRAQHPGRRDRGHRHDEQRRHRAARARRHVVIQAEVEVDETNIPNVQIGQPAKITIDALPDTTFKGHVTEIGNSPIRRPARRRGHAGHQLQGRR